MSEITRLSEKRRKLLRTLLRSGLPTTCSDDVAITARPEDSLPPLSFAQEQFWNRAQTPGIPPLYNECIIVHRRGPLDIAVLERCFLEVLQRHEIWRTSFGITDGQPFQDIHPAPSSFPLQVSDLRTLPEDERESEALRLAVHATRHPFNLQAGPLLRVSVIRVGDEEYRIILVAHLSIVDGVSVYQVFPAELKQLYEAFSVGKKSPLAPLNVQYADYAFWQRHSMEGERYEAQLSFWRNRLSGELPVLQWPRDFATPPIRSFRGVIQPFALDQACSEAVKELAIAEGVTLFTCLETAFAVLLHSYTGQTDLIFGTYSSSGRTHSEFQRSLGHFLNPVALRMDLSGDPSISELLWQTFRVTSESISNDEIPIDELARQLLRSPDQNRVPFFNTAISLQPSMQFDDEGWFVTSMDADSGGAMLDLYVAFIDCPERIIGRMQCNPDLLRASTISQTISDLRVVIAAAAANSKQRLSTLLQSTIRGHQSAD